MPGQGRPVLWVKKVLWVLEGTGERRQRLNSSKEVQGGPLAKEQERGEQQRCAQNKNRPRQRNPVKIVQPLRLEHCTKGGSEVSWALKGEVTPGQGDSEDTEGQRVKVHPST